MKSIDAFRYRGNTDTGGTVALTYNAYTVAFYPTGDPGQASAYIFLNSNGTITGALTNRGSSAWHTAPAAGVGSSFWCVLTLSSGTLTYGVAGTRFQLTSGYTFGITTDGASSPRVKTVTGTLEIWDAAAAGNLISSGTFLLEAKCYTDDELFLAKTDKR